MGERQSPRLAMLRAKIDETAARHAREIDALRAEIRRLERESAVAETPPPLPPETSARTSPNATAAPRSTSGFAPEPAGDPQPADPPPANAAAPPPEMAKPPVNRGELELNFGRVWLARIGIVLLVTGLVLLGNHAYQNWVRDLSAAARLTFLMLSALAVGGAGWRCTRHATLRAFGEVVLAGGMAYFYWCAYAAHHVGRLRVIESTAGGTLALLGAAAAIVAVSVARNARTTAVMGLLLASYSTVLQPMTALTAVSNVLLAATGVTLLALKRWRGPGFASMLGAYGAFLYWQLPGAAAAGGTTAALVFVAALWTVFAVPTLGAMRGLDARARAWWTGLNNGAGFGLFALVWLLAGWENFWGLAAAAGLLWLGLGLLGRRRSAAAETYLVQGLAALTLALVLKLEGYHLGLGLALESLLMAGAFRRFAKWPELAFSGLAMLGATAWLLARPDLPVWSLAVVTLLLAGASIILRRGGAADAPADYGRRAAALGVVCATATGLLWCARLPLDWRPLAAMAAAAVLGWRVLREEHRARMPEVFGASLVLALAAPLMLLAERPSAWSLGGVAAISGAAAWLWERRGNPASPERPAGQAIGASLAAWLHAFGGTLALAEWMRESGALAERFWMGIALATAVPIMAWRVLKCPRLRAATSLLLLLPLLEGIDRIGEPWWIAFAPPLAAWAVWIFAGRAPGISRPDEAMHAGLSRAVGGLGWMLAWHASAPEIWGDMLGLSVLAGWWVRRRFIPDAKPIELPVWGAVAAVVFFARLSFTGGAGVPTGWGVSAALIIAAFLRTRDTNPRVAAAIAWSAAIGPTLWASAWLLRHHDHAALTILWTLLGFAWVSAGLWRRFAALRLAGFALLLVALVKLFAIDVWRFDTFTRIAAFLALGVALLALGFFYNRFAELLKRLLEDRNAPETEATKPHDQGDP